MALFAFFALLGAALGAGIKRCPTVRVAPVLERYRYGLVGAKSAQFSSPR